MGKPLKNPRYSGYYIYVFIFKRKNKMSLRHFIIGVGIFRNLYDFKLGSLENLQRPGLKNQEKMLII